MSNLSQRSDLAIRRGSTLATILVGVCAAMLSFSGLSHLAAQESIAMPILFPIIIDGSMLAGSLALLHAVLRGEGATRTGSFARAIVAVGAAISIYGNVASGSSLTVSSIVVHASAPVAYLASMELILGVVRHRLVESQAQEQAAKIREQKRIEREQKKAALEVTASKLGKDTIHGRVARMQQIADRIPGWGSLTAKEQASLILAEIPGIKPREVVEAGVMAREEQESEERVRRRVYKALGQARGSESQQESPKGAVRAPEPFLAIVGE